MENKEDDNNRKLGKDDFWGIAGFILFAASIILPILIAPPLLAKGNPTAVGIIIAVEAIILVWIFRHIRRK